MAETFLELSKRTWFGRTDNNLEFKVTISFGADGGVRGHGEHTEE
jgi:hypothetical protein